MIFFVICDIGLVAKERKQMVCHINDDYLLFFTKIGALASWGNKKETCITQKDDIMVYFLTW